MQGLSPLYSLGFPMPLLPQSPLVKYCHLVYAQKGSSVQKKKELVRSCRGIHKVKLKGDKGIQTYHQNVGGSLESLLGIVAEFEAKKSKIRVLR